jgi:hypothetical protein
VKGASKSNTDGLRCRGAGTAHQPDKLAGVSRAKSSIAGKQGKYLCSTIGDRRGFSHMMQRGTTELITTGQPADVRAGPAEHRPGEHRPGEHSLGEHGAAGAAVHAQTDLDVTLARTLRRFIAEVSKADQPQVPSEAGQRRALPLREEGKRAAHLRFGRRDAHG